MLKRNTNSERKIPTSVVKASATILENKMAFRSGGSQTAKLVKAGRIGSANAIRASRALGLSIAYMEDGKLYREFSDGTRELIPTTIKKAVAKKITYSLRKGMVLHARK